jgi:hypothetical protein
VIARESRRTIGRLVALRVAPTFFFVFGRLVLVVLRDVVEHESAAVLVQEDAAFTTCALGDEDAPHARRHTGSRMELDELEIWSAAPRRKPAYPSPVYSQLLLVIL